MPAYAYTGLNASGKTIKGIETADSVAALKLALKRQGVYLTAVTEAAGGSASSSRATGGGGLGSREIDFGQLFDRIRPKDVAGVTRLMSTLLCAGVTLPVTSRGSWGREARSFNRAHAACPGAAI